MRALVVEDSRLVRGIMCQYLVAMGFEVFEAEDGVQGLERLNEMPSVEVVLVDWNMPRMDGCEFIRAARARSAYARTPMMMVTTETDPACVALALEAGANEYLMKPFDACGLHDKLVILGIEPDRRAA